MRFRFLRVATLALFGALLYSTKLAYSQVTCIQQYVASSDAKGLGFMPSDVENLVSEIASAIGLSPQGIKIIPCDGVAKAEANYLDKADVPKGEYIIYNPIWIREVIGTDISDQAKVRARYEAIFLFGHELGHLFGRHFTTHSGLPRLERETQADRFAGCAAGSLNADWQIIKEFIARIRGDKDTTHPSRDHSEAVAHEAFDSCRGRGSVSIKRYQVLGAGPEFSPPKMNSRTLDGCMISPEHPSGDDCSAQASQTIAATFCKEAGYLSSATFSALFTPEFKASYKLTKKVTSSGTWDYIWNEDDSGGFIINRVVCRR